MIMGKYVIVQCMLLVFATAGLVQGRSNAFQKRGAGCGMPKVLACLTKYVNVFQAAKDATDSSKTQMVIDVHCAADQVLASCAAKDSDCSEEVLNNMRSAILSYAVFDKKLKTCPNHDYQDLKRVVVKGKLAGYSEITKMDAYDEVQDCAVAVSRKCAAEYGRNMLANPAVSTLCTAIVSKASCLATGEASCKADIVKNVLAVFVPEGGKVLKVLCKLA